MMQDVDVEFIEAEPQALESVQNGTSHSFAMYDPTIDGNIEIVLTPFQIGNSSTTWTVLIGLAEDYILAPGQEMTFLILIIAIIAIVVTAAIIYVVLNGMTKPIVRVAENLKDIA
jgi:methyl-accepting chemotaxis protein